MAESSGEGKATRISNWERATGRQYSGRGNSRPRGSGSDDFSDVPF